MQPAITNYNQEQLSNLLESVFKKCLNDFFKEIIKKDIGIQEFNFKTVTTNDIVEIWGISRTTIIKYKREGVLKKIGVTGNCFLYDYQSVIDALGPPYTKNRAKIIKSSL